MGEKDAARAMREKSEREGMNKNKKLGKDDGDAKINYRGWRVMPFIIGN